MTATLTAGVASRALARRFAAAGLPTPHLDARLIVLEASGLTHAELIAEPDTRLSPDAAEAVEAMAGRRLSREPLSRLLGRREFYGRTFALGPDTLDPRPETETLVEHVLAWAKAQGRSQAHLRLLDLGTGTGAILVSLLAELPQAVGVGTDVSPRALALARGNGRQLGVGERASWLAAHWCEGIAGRFDAIVSNPPYIRTGELAGLEPEVRLGDPRVALDGGPDGLAAYRAIAEGAGRLLAREGLLALEVGAGQDAAVEAIFAAAGFGPHPVTGGEARDLADRVRVVSFALVD
jgi:release factor glutamine methyltransferase